MLVTFWWRYDYAWQAGSLKISQKKRSPETGLRIVGL